MFINIREKLGPIIVILIGLSLGVFILETALSSNASLLRGNKDIAGVIDGNKINIKDYSDKVEEMTTNYKQQNGGQVNDDLTHQIQEQTWDQMVDDYINQKENDALNLQVTIDEKKDLFFSNDPSPLVRQAFTNRQTGQFDPAVVRNVAANINKTNPNDNTDVATKVQQWNEFEDEVVKDRLNRKLQGMVTGAIYVPKWEAQMKYDEQNQKAAISYIQVPYTSISDSTIKVTDDELQSYLNDHKDKYKEDETRKIEFVYFPVTPTSDDTSDAKKQITDIYTKLASNPGDTDYIRLNADNGLDKRYYNSASLPQSKTRDTLFKIKTGQVIGPILENSGFTVVEVLGRRDLPDSVKARHILFAVDQQHDSVSALKKADSVLQAIQKGSDFAMMAYRYSDDKGSAQKGGELGFMAEGLTVQPFNDYLFFTGKKGAYSIVRTQFGYHIIQIEDYAKIEPAVQYASFSKPIQASSTTDKTVYNAANSFASNHLHPQEFEKALAPAGAFKQTADQVHANDYQLPGVGAAREVIKWAFNGNQGDVSQVYSVNQNYYVVAFLAEVRPKGTTPLNDIRPEITAILRKQKKGDIISKQIEDAMKVNISLNDLATKLNAQVKTTDEISFASQYIKDLGVEPKLTGTVFVMNENQISKPIAGDFGVYVAQVTSLQKPQPIADYSQIKQQAAMMYQQQMQYGGLSTALKKAITVEDDRYRFY
jgi:peptidyl-prolyl cis-trans isomerase D